MLNLLFVLMTASVFAPLLFYKFSLAKNTKVCMMLNVITFFGLLLLTSAYCISSAVTVYASGEAVGITVGEGLRFIGAALSTGLSGIGGGVAVARAASAAIDAMNENEDIMGKTLIFVALAEGIALYGLVISILILNG